MAYVVPNSTITLYTNVPITNQQQIAFKTLAQQTSYFTSKILRSKVNCSYVRRNGRLKIEDGMGLMLTCNYISFKNPSFENKTIYARVIDYSYINNATVEIAYAVDWFQTFMFDVTYEDGMLQREHLSVADWTKVEANPYNRTVYEMFTPENLPVSKDMEKRYEIPAAGKTYLSPTGSTGSGIITKLDSQDYAYTQLFDTFQTSKDICMLISDFDYAELDATALKSFWDNFHTIYTTGDWKAYRIESGFVLGAGNRLQGEDDGHGNPVYLNSAVPHCYNICFMSFTNGDTDKLQNVIDYMTLQGVTHCIIGIYQVSADFKAFLAESGTQGFNYAVAPVDSQTLVNKKLLHAPFQYIRVESASGDAKEYHYEEFLARNTDGTFNIRYLATMNGMPCVMIMPFKYKYTSYATHTPTVIDLFGYNPKVGFNIGERIEFNTFPQIGYVTDAYLTYLSEQYTQNLQGRTHNSEYYAKAYSDMSVIDSWGGRIGTTAEGVISGATKGYAAGSVPGAIVGGLVGAGYGFVKGDLAYESTVSANENLYQMYGDSDRLRNIGADTASLIATGDRGSGIFEEAKSGFVCDEYHPSNANGANLSLSEFGNIESFKITRVQLRQVFIEKYDAYFTHYGYSSSRIGVPRICNFMQNSSDNTKLPKFLTQTNGYSMTYVKTQSMNVESTMKPVADFIEAMFNNGMRFIDGTTLLPSGNTGSTGNSGS